MRMDLKNNVMLNGYKMKQKEYMLKEFITGTTIVTFADSKKSAIKKAKSAFINMFAEAMRIDKWKVTHKKILFCKGRVKNLKIIDEVAKMNRKAQIIIDGKVLLLIIIIISILYIFLAQNQAIQECGNHYLAGCETYNHQTAVLNQLIQDMFWNSSTVFQTMNCSWIKETW